MQHDGHAAVWVRPHKLVRFNGLTITALCPDQVQKMLLLALFIHQVPSPGRLPLSSAWV